MASTNVRSKSPIKMITTIKMDQQVPSTIPPIQSVFGVDNKKEAADADMDDVETVKQVRDSIEFTQGSTDQYQA